MSPAVNDTLSNTRHCDGHISHYDSMAPASVNMTQLALKAGMLCEIIHNDDQWATQGQSSFINFPTNQKPACDFLPISTEFYHMSQCF